MGVTHKFVLVFSILLMLVMFAALTGYLSYRYMRRAEQNIRAFTQIRELVLQMDRGLEKARRLHQGFILQYSQIGFQQAHEQYAQPSVREISKVITLSGQLREILFSEEKNPGIAIHPADVNLFLASAKRFADTSIAATELITDRGAPERGVESGLRTSFSSLNAIVLPIPRLWSLYNRAHINYKQYLIHRQRHLMQSSLNELYKLSELVETDPGITPVERRMIIDQLVAISNLAGSLLDIDLELSGRLRDFTLQEKAVAPVAANMIRLSGEKVAEAGRRIDLVFIVTGLVMVVITFLVALTVLFLARLMHTDVTRPILQLSEVTGKLHGGSLDVRVQINSEDELGRLAKIFNAMAEKMEDLVNNLEQKVQSRTMELAASELRFRSLVHDLPKIAVQGYNANHEVVYWNQASEALFGYTSREAVGRTIEDLIVPVSSREEIVRNIFNGDEVQRSIPSSELVLHNKDGHEVNVYSSHVTQVIGGEKIFYCIDIDLGELKSAQEEHRKSEAFYRQLFDQSSSGVSVYDAVEEGRDFIFKDINQAGELIENVRREDVLGRRVTEMFPAVKECGLLDLFQKVWSTGESGHHPVCLYSDGRIQGWRENRVYKLPSGEIVSVYDDRTEHKRVEQEKKIVELRLQRAQKMEAIGLLAGGVAHDLNNILSAIVGYPDLIAMRLPEDSDLQKPLATMKQAGERASAVVADLLTVARGVAGTRKPEDVHVLIREYLDSPEYEQLQRQYPDVRVICSFNENIPMIHCSSVHVTKCLMNLVANGMEAIETQGVVTLETNMVRPEKSVLAAGGLKDGEYVSLSVSDTGQGIEDRDLEHIFEPFYTKKVMGKRSGTGLGLSVVWNTMKEHDGTVWVESDRKGTAFTLYFPAVDGSRARQEKPEVQKPEISKSRERILVVDDEAQQRDLMQSMLEHYGYRVEACESGEKAVSLLKDQGVDLVVLDMLMDPGMNGRQTYEKILELHPKQRAVIVSGFSRSDDVKAVMEMGAGTFVRKPFSMEQLGVAVQNELNRKHL